MFGRRAGVVPVLRQNIPPEKSGEFFGIYDICGKGASFMGTALMGLFAQITETGGGVAILAVMFLIGYVLFRKAAAMNASKFQ
ncbi:MAG: MFS transporter [Hungatella hathewayi]